MTALIAFYVAHKDAINELLLAMLVVSEGLPFFHRLEANGWLHGLYLAIKKRLAPAAVVFVLLAFVSGCACFKPESPSYNSKACVIARTALDCTKGSVVSLITAVGPAIALAILSGAPIDLRALAEKAEQGAVGNGLCILAAIQTSLERPGTPYSAYSAAKEKTLDALQLMARKVYGPGPLDVKVARPDGSVALVTVP